MTIIPVILSGGSVPNETLNPEGIFSSGLLEKVGLENL